MSEASEAPDEPRRRLPLAWAIGLALLALGSLAALALLSAGVARRSSAIERIRLSGAPLWPEDIVVPPQGPGEDTAAWLKRLDECSLGLRSWRDLGERESFERLLSSEELQAPWARGALEALDGCHAARVSTSGERGAPWSAWVPELRRARFHRPRSWSELDACEQALLEAEAAVHENCMQPALEAPRHPRADLRRALTDAIDMAARFGFGYVEVDGQVLRAVEAQLAGARRAGIDGRSEQAVAALATAIETTGFHSGFPVLIAAMMETQALRQALDELHVACALLPSGADLRPIEEALGRLDPRADLRTALQGERTWVLDWHRRGNVASFDELGWRSLPYRLFEGSDLGVYLELMEETLGWLDQAPWVMRATRRSESVMAAELPFYAFTARVAWPRLHETVDEVLEGETQLLLTRGALLARREGFAAGAAWAEATTDPFSGSPLRSRLEPDGSWTLWSVGPDGADDGVPDPPPKAPADWACPDLFWRLRKP